VSEARTWTGIAVTSQAFTLPQESISKESTKDQQSILP
jgi:hypothetical protein